MGNVTGFQRMTSPPQQHFTENSVVSVKSD